MSSDVIWSNYALTPQDGRDQGPLQGSHPGRPPGCGGICRSKGDTGLAQGQRRGLLSKGMDRRTQTEERQTRVRWGGGRMRKRPQRSRQLTE